MRHEQMIALAGEYVLGLLSARDAAAAEARMETDIAFRSAVADWRDRLVDLNEVTESILPSADLWKRISGTWTRHETGQRWRCRYTARWQLIRTARHPLPRRVVKLVPKPPNPVADETNGWPEGMTLRIDMSSMRPSSLDTMADFA
jgi:hypothetical protein